MTESKIDDKIQQCESDIKSLQKNLEGLKEQKKKDETYIASYGDVVLMESCYYRVIIQRTNSPSYIGAVDSCGELVCAESQDDFRRHEYKKITTLKEVIDFWRENHA